MSEWISVKDRLPEKDDEYLAWLRGGRFAHVVFYKPKLWDYAESLVNWTGVLNKQVTHWMPLPEAPQKERE